MPKKAKKGGGGKGGGKTEEERLMFLQQRAQAEEEMAKKKEEILTLFLKDKLQKEERNTAVNLLKLNDGWRSILRQTRAAELRRDLTVLSQTFERQLDGLDGVVKNLERDLQEAERQAARVRRIHLQHVERLWAEQDERLACVQQQWEGGLQRLSSSFSSEREQISAQSVQQRADLEDAALTVQEQHKALMSKIDEMYSESIAAYNSRHQEMAGVLNIEIQKQLKARTHRKEDSVELCKHQWTLSSLISETKMLTEQADEATRRVQQLQEFVLHQRAMLTTNRTNAVPVEQDLTATRDQMYRKTLALRDQLTQTQRAARKQLTELTVQSDNATKKLRAVIAKGQKVLRVAELCRKLESEQKKVFPSLLLSEDLGQERPGPETEEPVQEISQLQQVTRSICGAVLRREALRKQRDDLSRENQQLRLLLRQHLDGMTVSGPDLDGRHALLTVCQAPTTTAPPDSDRRHTVIEAVHAVKHSL